MRIYGVLVLVCVLLETAFIITTYHMVDKQVKSEAKAHAEEIAADIQTAIHHSFETTELLKDLYKVYGSVFLNDFDKICNQLTQDNLAIGSMYFAPQGIIKYSFPEKVDSATANFEMLMDPIQGPKAQKAIDDRKPTIAGPHQLVEGGEGFIIRTPIFKRDQFIAFTIIVLDKNRIVSQVDAKIGNSSYEYAVWKSPDPTAVVDKNGFIFTSRKEGNPVSREVQTSFDVLNDIWFIAIEPVGGWNILEAMKSPLIISIIVFASLIVLLYLSIIAIGRKRRLQMEILSNNAKSSFLFSMSHDIRTPMNAIIGFTDLMKKNLDDKKKLTDYLSKIQASSDFLLSLINNVLEMARIESGKMTLAQNVISTQHFEDVTEAVFTDLAIQKGIDFSNKYSLKHDFVIGDEMKIRELTLNIVSNAIKYTPPGGYVKLSLLEMDNEKPGYTTFIAISEDSGVGISKEYLPHIFEEFSREKNSTDSKISGTGLGMPIVKKLIDLMEGTIDIQSEVGKGTTITIKLPLRIATEEEAKTAREILEQKKTESTHIVSSQRKAESNVNIRNNASCEESSNKIQREIMDFSGKRVLLAEDNDLNAEIAIAILEEKGFNVVRAADGIKCLNILDQYIEGYFDIVLMDIQMPRMNGYDATKAIRALPEKTKANIPIIAMTANAFDEDRQRAFEAGMNGHIAKPIDVILLLKAIAEVLK